MITNEKKGGFMKQEEKEYQTNNPFTVPEGYFETLNDRLVEHVEESIHPPKATWVRVMRPYFGLAGVFVFAMLMLHWVLPQAFSEQPTETSDPIEAYWQSVMNEQDLEFDEDFNPTKDEIIEYLTQEMDAFDFYWIAGKY